MNIIKPQYTTLLKKQLCRRIELNAIGNSNRKLKDIAIDLINESHLSYSVIADGCYLADVTIKNLAEEKTKNPQSETIERIFRYFEMSVSLKGENIESRYLNCKKEL